MQWLSGRVLDSRPRGHRFEPHRRHCVVVFEQDTFILQPRKTHPCLTERLLMGHKESNQTNKHIDGRHFAFGADPAVVPIPGHMASLLFYLSFIGMVLVVIATRHI